MASITWERELAQVYDDVYAAMFERRALDPVVDLLVDLARGGPALEFAVGTGRVALPLSARGVPTHGLELSPAMVEQLQAKPGSEAVAVTVGDMSSTVVEGCFSLVYVVANSIMNLTTQEEQTATFANAAAHLQDGGCFVVELILPQLQHVPPGDSARVFTLDPNHVGIETFDDLVGQIASSHHWMHTEGRLVRHTAPYRYIWPSELVLMGQLAGLRLRERWGDWSRTPFTSSSTRQVAVFQKPEP